MMKKITLTNSFHGTEITVLVKSAALLAMYPSELSKSQRRTVKRIRLRLCSTNDCACGVVR
jgi:hypothetical protein